jgi:hypothetical protein
MHSLPATARLLNFGPYHAPPRAYRGWSPVLQFAKDPLPQEGTPVTMSHLEFAMEASEDFECDVKGAGQIENLNSYN